MTGSSIEKDSTSRQNDFSEWTHLSVPYIIYVTPYCATQIYTEQINQFPTGIVINFKNSSAIFSKKGKLCVNSRFPFSVTCW